MKQLLKDFLAGLYFIIASIAAVMFLGLIAIYFPSIIGVLFLVLIITGIGKIVNLVSR